MKFEIMKASALWPQKDQQPNNKAEWDNVDKCFYVEVNSIEDLQQISLDTDDELVIRFPPNPRIIIYDTYIE